MSLVTHNHYYIGVDAEDFIQKLDQALSKLNKIMAALDDLKAKLATSGEKIDILVTATTGIKEDVAFLKAKLEQNTGGIDATGVAELLTIVQGQDDKLGQAASDLQALDAETDSSEPTPE